MKFKDRSVFLAVLLTFVPAAYASSPKANWAINTAYRIDVTVDPGPGKRVNAPVAAEIDFTELLKKQGINGRLDQSSIRVVRYDPASGRSQHYRPGSLAVPHELSHDFYYQDSGKIWWRIQDERDTHFQIYFDTASGWVQPQNVPIALVGVGDNFHLNNGSPGPLDVSMSASVRFIDWDGDGKKDLLVGSSQTHEYGVPTDHGYIHFFKNIGTVQAPLFAPGFQLRDEAGGYIQTLSGVYTYFDLQDWDEDGDIDILVASGPKIYLAENTGRRDRDNLPILRPYRQVLELAQGNDYAPQYYYKFPRWVDWDGDGDLDIIYGIFLQKIDPKCSNTQTICYWDEVLQFYELHENIGQKGKGQPIYAKPKIIRTARGLPLNTFNFGGEDFADWDGDGDLDALIGDMWNYPAGASQVLFYENFGSRTKPELLMGVPVVARIEEIGRGANPLVVDWDGDGDKDLLVAGAEGWVKIYKNIGKDARGIPQLDKGEFVQQIQPKITDGEQTRTAVADWNGDGIPDLIRGGGNGWVTYYQNIGTTVDPVFRPPVRLKAAGQEIRLINGLRDCPQGPSEPHAGYTAPVVIDFDKDGDLDLIVGDMRGYQTYFENVGTRTKPQLAGGRLMTVNGERRSFGWRNEVAAGDIDGDGQVEVVTTAYTDRHVSIYKPEFSGGDRDMLKMIRTGPVKLDTGEDLLPPHSGGNNNGDYMMKLADWDNDGDLDLFIGSVYWLWYYENVGTKREPKFKFHGKVQVEGKDLLVSGHAGSIEVVDWSGDNQKDILIGGEAGWTYYFERSFLEGRLPKSTVGALEARN